MTSQDMTHDTGPGEDDEVVVAELVEDAGALEPRVPVVGVDPQYVDLYRRLRAEGGVDLREQLHNRYLQLARGGVTPGGLPWPSPTDPVAEGADAIRALAEALDAKIHDSGWVLITPNTGFTGNATYYRLIAGKVRFRGYVTRAAGPWTSTEEAVFEMPDDLWPDGNLRVPVAGTAGQLGTCSVIGGVVSLAISPGFSSTSLYLTALSYPVRPR